MKTKFKYLNYSLLFLLVSFGIILCFTGGYGSDEDTLPMIGVFETLVKTGQYMSSRFTGYPVAEIIIGFFSYNFGSYAINLIIFLSLAIGAILFYLSVSSKKNVDEIVIFLIAILTNHVIFFDNLEPIDYSLAFLFFSIGGYLYKKEIYPLAITFFAICIGTRINYGLFIIVFIFFNNQINLSYLNRLILAISSLFSGCLFYLPIWFQSRLTLKWLTAARPLDQDIFGLFARFAYKSWVAFGVFASFFIIYFIFKNKKKIINTNNFKLLFLIILSNFLLFLYIPAELSYLQLGIISTLLIIIKNIKLISLYFLLSLNILQWFVEISPISINYLSDKPCQEVHATGADISFNLIDGRIFKYFNSRNKIECWLHGKGSERAIRILEGKKTKID